MKLTLKWPAIIAGLVALSFGMMLLIKSPALGLSEASFCGQCHAMDEQVNTYLHSSHANVTNCGDCHSPDNLVIGSIHSAYTGARDVYRVVTNTTPPVITATDLTRDILQDNCIRCHGEIIGNIGDTSQNGGTNCFECHQSIVHPKK
ncbi:MAG: cytochrome C nitrite reductase [Syntrophomonadaceae bacterium]|nr:cytochrome C nitrite reductase [Syntrophomonadaceae bacterium]